LLQLGEARHPQLVSETRSTEGGLDWRTVLYSEDGGVKTGLWMADLNGWTLEYRATYAMADEPKVLADLRAFTTIVEKSAGARLALCGKSTPPDRGASAISDAHDLAQSSLMTSILGGAVLAAAQDSKGTPKAPTTWCVETSLRNADYDMVFWRGVDPDGTDARTDRITLVTVGPPPSLEVAPDSLADLMTDKAKTDGKGPRWTATSERDGQILIFGYFDGRPSAKTLSDLFARILKGKTKPIGGYGAKGKNLTIIWPPSS